MVGKTMNIKVTLKNLVLCYKWSGPMACCPFDDCQIYIDFAPCFV